MTSDAKIGLLLGLAFIFIIAFIINGLPGFHKDANNNELTTNMVSSQNNPPAIAAKEREIINQRGTVEKRPPKAAPPSTGNQDIRFETALPKSHLVRGETNETKPVAAAQPLPAVKKNESRKVETSRPTLSKVYVVNEGDNLAVIAKKFYGPEKGNKKINITRIFEANRKLLKSADEIYEGQKIVIPPLVARYQNKNKTDNIFTSTMFKKVDSIGKGRLLADGRRTKRSRWYAVQEGDSLWRIAAMQLGDGSRYTKIAKLNADILDDEDYLAVGMRLKLPAR